MQYRMNRTDAGVVFTALVVLEKTLAEGGEQVWAEARRTLDENLVVHGHAPTDIVLEMDVGQFAAHVQKCASVVGFQLLEPEKLREAIERKKQRIAEASARKVIELTAKTKNGQEAKRTVVVKANRRTIGGG